MDNINTLRIFDIVGGGLCVSSDDGQTVHDRIAHLLRENQKVVISFEGVDTLISAFLNASIGQLYGEFTEEHIREYLAVDNILQDDRMLLKRVIDNAKIYFKNRKSFDEAWRIEVNDEE
ncbi:MAG: STAS-like domain-containing protein [Methylococcaceae bacterium]|nr:STAS-like domain-containing protein [Methylococcaceae bacterium]